MEKRLTPKEACEFFNTHNLNNFYIRETNGQIAIMEKPLFLRCWLGRLIRRIFGLYQEYNHKSFLAATRKILDYVEKYRKNIFPNLTAQYTPRNLRLLAKRMPMRIEINSQLARILTIERPRKPTTRNTPIPKPTSTRTTEQGESTKVEKTKRVVKRSGTIRESDVIELYRKDPNSCSLIQKKALFWSKNLIRLQDLITKLTGDETVQLNRPLALDALCDYLTCNAKDSFSEVTDWLISSDRLTAEVFKKILEVIVEKNSNQQPISEYDLNRLLMQYSQKDFGNDLPLTNENLQQVISILFEKFPNENNTLKFIDNIVSRESFSFSLLIKCASLCLQKMETHRRTIEYPGLNMILEQITKRDWTSDVDALEDGNLKALLKGASLTFAPPPSTAVATPQPVRAKPPLPRTRSNTVGSNRAMESFRKGATSLSKRENMTLFQDIKTMDEWFALIKDITKETEANWADSQIEEIIKKSFMFSTLSFTEILINHMIDQSLLSLERLILCLSAILERREQYGSVSTATLFALLKYNRRHLHCSDDTITKALNLLKEKDKIMATALER